MVEMGKLSLVQALQFIARHIPPENWSLLYSNVDNLVILLKGAGHLDKAIYLASTGDYAQYLREKAHWVADNCQEAQPGQLKLEWICNLPSWKFITCAVQHYVLREEEQAQQEEKEEDTHASRQLRAELLLLRVQKTASLNNLSSKSAFEFALSLMFGSGGSLGNAVPLAHKNVVVVPQDCCISKLGSMITQCKVIVFSCGLKK